MLADASSKLTNKWHSNSTYDEQSQQVSMKASTGQVVLSLGITEAKKETMSPAQSTEIAQYWDSIVLTYCLRGQGVQGDQGRLWTWTSADSVFLHLFRVGLTMLQYVAQYQYPVHVYAVKDLVAFISISLFSYQYCSDHIL